MSLRIGKQSHVERCLGNPVFPPGRGEGVETRGRFVPVLLFCLDIFSFPRPLLALEEQHHSHRLYFLLVLPHLSASLSPSTHFSCDEKKATRWCTISDPRHKIQNTKHVSSTHRRAMRTSFPGLSGPPEGTRTQALRCSPAISCFSDALKHHPQLAVVKMLPFPPAIS